ncbi:MAG: dihydroorotase [Clostridia bacterium]
MNNYYELESGLLQLPAFCDMHTHLREPGFAYKETIYTGTKAAAKGGYTMVLTMPNLNPPPDNLENLNVQMDIIKKSAVIDVMAFASITKGQLGKGELSDMDRLAPFVAGFSDDGKGIQDKGLMKEAMSHAKKLKKAIIAHCEDNSLIQEGGVVDEVVASKFGLIGISRESEWKQIERDLNLAAITGCRYHVCHISTAEGVNLVREAKKSHIKVSCETAPHYLSLSQEDMVDDGKFKMNPPLRSRFDKEALIKGLWDGTIDIIATDHAPHTAEEKSKGLKGSSMGVVGLETAFSVMYTMLVKTGIIDLNKLIELMAIRPRQLLRLFDGSNEKIDKINADYIVDKLKDYVIIDSDKSFVIKKEEFMSMGKSTPFENMSVIGEIQKTVHRGRTVYKK